MVQNAMRNAAKRKTKKHKYPLELYKQNLLEPLKRGLKRAKQALKVEVLGAKSG